MHHQEEHRPWGYFQVLSDQADHKVKRIVVYPAQRLSLQRHRQRREHWFVLCGEAIVTLDNGEYPLQAGESIDIPEGVLHRVLNPGTVELALIEVQTGRYFGEDDIERVADDYGR